MSARPGILTSASAPADGGQSPNRVRPIITAEVRCSWPPLATDAQIEAVLAEAVVKARQDIAAKRGER